MMSLTNDQCKKVKNWLNFFSETRAHSGSFSTTQFQKLCRGGSMRDFPWLAYLCSFNLSSCFTVRGASVKKFCILKIIEKLKSARNVYEYYMINKNCKTDSFWRFFIFLAQSWVTGFHRKFSCKFLNDEQKKVESKLQIFLSWFPDIVSLIRPQGAITV